MSIVATDDSDTYTLGRTPLNEGSASRRDLCNIQHPQDTSMFPAGFEPAIPASERPL